MPLPPVIVNPSSTLSGPSPAAHMTTDRGRPVASIVVAFAPAALRTAIALPRKSIVSMKVPGPTRTSDASRMSTRIRVTNWRGEVARISIRRVR